MATTQDDIRGWLKEAKRQKATHLIVVVDTFDHQDYPVYVKPGEDIHAQVAHYNGPNMQRVMEVYNLSLDWEHQLATRRAWNL